MPAKVDLASVTVESLVLQKKILFVFYLTGKTQSSFCEELGIANSYLSELKQVGRVYDPLYSFLIKFSKTFSVDISWLSNPDIMPSTFLKSAAKGSHYLTNTENFISAQDRFKELREAEKDTLPWIEDQLNIPDKNQGEMWEKKLTEGIREFFKPINI